jgi:hypothetical protein
MEVCGVFVLRVTNDCVTPRFGQIETRNHFIICLLKNLCTRATRQKLGVAGNVSDKIKHGLSRVWQ